MEQQLAWLSTLGAILLWAFVLAILGALAWCVWKKRLHRFLLLNGGHGLATVICTLLLPIALSSVGHTDGFGAWKLVPIVIATPPVMLALIVWGLVARSRSDDPAHRLTALAFSVLALVPLGAIVLIVFGGG